MKRRVVPCIRTLYPGSPDELVPRQSSNQQLKAAREVNRWRKQWQLSMAIRVEDTSSLQSRCKACGPRACKCNQFVWNWTEQQGDVLVRVRAGRLNCCRRETADGIRTSRACRLCGADACARARARLCVFVLVFVCVSGVVCCSAALCLRQPPRLAVWWTGRHGQSTYRRARSDRAVRSGASDRRDR